MLNSKRCSLAAIVLGSALLFVAILLLLPDKASGQEDIPPRLHANLTPLVGHRASPASSAAHNPANAADFSVQSDQPAETPAAVCQVCHASGVDTDITFLITLAPLSQLEARFLNLSQRFLRLKETPDPEIATVAEALLQFHLQRLVSPRFDRVEPALVLLSRVEGLLTRLEKRTTPARWTEPDAAGSDRGMNALHTAPPQSPIAWSAVFWRSLAPDLYSRYEESDIVVLPRILLIAHRRGPPAKFSDSFVDIAIARNRRLSSSKDVQSPVFSSFGHA